MTIILITKPVVVEALGLIKKGLDTSRIPGNVGTNEIQKITMLTSRIPGNIGTNEIQKIIMLGTTAHILREVLSLK